MSRRTKSAREGKKRTSYGAVISGSKAEREEFSANRNGENKENGENEEQKKEKEK